MHMHVRRGPLAAMRVHVCVAAVCVRQRGHALMGPRGFPRRVQPEEV